MLEVLEMPTIKKMLVLNASSHGDTLDDVLTSFKAKALHGVVLSKVDEAVKLGPALERSFATGGVARCRQRPARPED
jgi:flagellar biosynthesis protein FlhF